MTTVTQKARFSLTGELRKAFVNFAHHAKLLAQLGGCNKPMARMGNKSYPVTKKPTGGRQHWCLRGIDKPTHSSKIDEIYESGAGKR